jgi:hypothetical protein
LARKAVLDRIGYAGAGASVLYMFVAPPPKSRKRRQVIMREGGIMTAGGAISREYLNGRPSYRPQYSKVSSRVAETRRREKEAEEKAKMAELMVSAAERANNMDDAEMEGFLEVAEEADDDIFNDDII